MFGDAQTRRWATRTFNVPLFRASFRPDHDGMWRSAGDIRAIGVSGAEQQDPSHKEFSMHVVGATVALSVAALVAACASPGATNTPPAAPAMVSMDAGAPGPMRDMDPRMKTMQEMHQKMMDAKTPAERQTLMGDPMKAMQGGMAIMKDMHGPGGMGVDMMGDRMPPAPMT
jgi:hypothetical protein